MASVGKMVMENDGNDFNHREKVADRYKVSGTNKSRLKVLLLLHWLVGGVHLVRLLPGIDDLLGLALALPFSDPPSPHVIDWSWLISMPFTLVAVVASRKSKASGMQAFQFGIVGAGITPVLRLLFFHSPDVLQYLSTGSTNQLLMWEGYPFSVLWSAFLTICLAIHIAEIVVARILISAWSTKKKM